VKTAIKRKPKKKTELAETTARMYVQPGNGNCVLLYDQNLLEIYTDASGWKSYENMTTSLRMLTIVILSQQYDFINRV
jgi:hypothetical protein